MTSAPVKTSAAVKATAATVESSTEARLSAHGIASGHATVIKTAERSGVRVLLAMDCKSTLRSGVTNETIAVNATTM